jgi:hypothetical protein
MVGSCPSSSAPRTVQTSAKERGASAATRNHLQMRRAIPKRVQCPIRISGARTCGIGVPRLTTALTEQNGRVPVGHGNSDGCKRATRQRVQHITRGFCRHNWSRKASVPASTAATHHGNRPARTSRRAGQGAGVGLFDHRGVRRAHGQVAGLERTRNACTRSSVRAI